MRDDEEFGAEDIDQWLKEFEEQETPENTPQHKDNQPSASTSQPALSVYNPGENTRVRDLLAEIKKTHTAWDINNRQTVALISQSKACSNTTGCKFEQDLEAACEKCNKLHQDIMSYECKSLQGKSFDKDDFKRRSELVHQIALMIKFMRSRAKAMEPWFKI